MNMKNINLVFTDTEHNSLLLQKGDMTWHDFMMKLAVHALDVPVVEESEFERNKRESDAAFTKEQLAKSEAKRLELREEYRKLKDAGTDYDDPRLEELRERMRSC
jgi:hypothetical protein